MSTNLYEVLGVSKDATSDQIRKAYKKQALKTHPDKLPVGLSEEEKGNAAEKFREISHACEILTDSEKRKEYDTHGVWPPPEPETVDFDDVFFNDIPSHRQGRRSRGFSSPFFTSHSHRSHEAYAFRDPFELFDAIFRDFDDIFSAHARHSASSSTPFSPFRPHRSRSLFDDPFFASAPTFPAFPPPIPSIPPMFMAPFPLTFEDTGGSRRQGAQTTSYVSHTVNGATRSTHTRCDKDGNEHVINKYPDGREVYTINNVEQPVRRQLEQLPSTRPPHHNTSYSRSTQLNQRNVDPARRGTYPPPEQEYFTPQPSYSSHNSSSRTHGQSSERSPQRDRNRWASDIYADTSRGGPEHYNERDYRRTQRPHRP